MTLFIDSLRRRSDPRGRQVEDLLAGLLASNPLQRPTAVQVLQSPALSEVRAELVKLGLVQPLRGDTAIPAVRTTISPQVCNASI